MNKSKSNFKMAFLSQLLFLTESSDSLERISENVARVSVEALTSSEHSYSLSMVDIPELSAETAFSVLSYLSEVKDNPKKAELLQRKIVHLLFELVGHSCALDALQCSSFCESAFNIIVDFTDPWKTDSVMKAEKLLSVRNTLQLVTEEHISHYALIDSIEGNL